MKKNYSLHKKTVGILSAAILLTGITTKAQTYCNSAFTDVTWEHITNVSFAGQINNSSSGNIGGPVNYLSQVANVSAGSTYPLSVSILVDGNEYVSAFIDWNQNGVLNDPGETYVVATNVNTAGPFNINVAVPPGATPGTTRMRVMLAYNQTPSPCLSATYGEAEDYSIFVIPPTPCSGTPATSTVSVATPSICAGGNSNLSLSALSSYTLGGITYQWYSSTVSTGPFTAIPNGTIANYNSGALNSTTYFMAAVTCSAGGTMSTSIESVQVLSQIINSVPYLETFEGITANNQLPNCQWSTIGTMFPGNGNYGSYWGTQIGANTYYGNGQQNHTPGGSKYAFFMDEYPGGNPIFFTNAFQLYAGVNYSAAVWYVSDGYNPKNISLNVSTAQTAATQTLITQVNSSNTTYQKMGSTFTVATDGIYYISVKNAGNPNNYDMISFDDLEVTIPCSTNPASFEFNVPNTVCAGSQATLTAVAGSPSVTSASSYTWHTGAQTASIVETINAYTTYTVNAISNFGCTNTKTVGIGTWPLPNINIFTLDDEVCAGESINLIAMGSALTYSWDNGGSNNPIINITPSVTTMYSLSGTDINGCVNTTNKTIIVNPIPQIVPVSSAQNQTVCANEKVDLNAVGAVSYTWTGPGTYLIGSGISVYPTKTVEYTVFGTDENGCHSSASIAQAVDACLGVQTISGNASNLSIYPNPNNGTFSVEFNNSLEKTVDLTDITGRVVMSNTTSQNKIEFNINHLANGVYYLRVKSDNATQTVKVVKQ